RSRQAGRCEAAGTVLADHACRSGLRYRRSRVLIQRPGSGASPPTLPRLICGLLVVPIMIRVLNRLDQPDQCQRHEVGVGYPPCRMCRMHVRRHGVARGRRGVTPWAGAAPARTAGDAGTGGGAAARRATALVAAVLCLLVISDAGYGVADGGPGEAPFVVALGVLPMLY